MSHSIHEYDELKKLRFWCQKVLPLVYDDSLTYYELLCKVVDKLNTIVTTDTKLIEDIKSLNDYVNNYLTTENLQPLINNKLNEMVADGTLDKIINQKIFNDLNSKINLLFNRKIVFVGDSYGIGYTPDGDVESWCTKVADKLGMNTSDYYNVSAGHAGFVSTTGVTFKSLLENASSTITNKNEITDIIVVGGYNDRNAVTSEILSYMGLFKTYCNTNYPNAKICVGFCACNISDTTILNTLGTTLQNYIYCAKDLGINYLNGIENCTFNVDLWSSDGFHPNNSGQNQIANAVVDSFLTGYASTYLSGENIPILINSTLFSGANGNMYCSKTKDGYKTCRIERKEWIFNTATNITCDGAVSHGVVVGTLEHSPFVNIGFIPAGMTTFIITTSSGFTQCSGYIYIVGNEIRFIPVKTNDSGSGYATLSAIAILNENTEFPVNVWQNC